MSSPSQTSAGRWSSVISRQEVIELIDTVMVAPIRSSIIGAPSEIVVGVAEGLKHEWR